MPWVLFFDGDCGFCNRSIRRLVDWDDEGLIHYAPLQGKTAEERGLEKYLHGEQASMVLLNETSGELVVQSDGLLQIVRLLGGLWKILLIFKYIPKAWRDGLYRSFARKRHRFGTRPEGTCGLPDQKILSRLRD